MATIRISRAHRLEPERIRAEVEDLAQNLARELSASYRWNGDRLDFERSGASGFIDIHADRLEIEIKLGMLLSPLKATVEKKINDYLGRALA